jgi:transcriptional regulator GlxA family with amidase domain
VNSGKSPSRNPWRRPIEPEPPSKQCRSFGPDRQNGNRPLVLGILGFEGVEVLDFAGPFEVFAVTGQMFNRIRVVTIAAKKQITAMNGLNIVVDHVIGDRKMPELDVLVLPGSNTSVTDAAVTNPVHLKWIKSIEPKLDYLISVCTGVSFLGRLGLVNGLDITTHHQWFDTLPTYAPNSVVRRGWRFTDNGRILTSAGISAGIDVSLYFVKRMFGKADSDGVASRMEYDWKDWNYDTCKGPILPPTTTVTPNAKGLTGKSYQY